jgi:hypothetical protein
VESLCSEPAFLLSDGLVRGCLGLGQAESQVQFHFVGGSSVISERDQL